MNRYIFILRGHLMGPVVDSWYKMTDHESEDKSVMASMLIRSRANLTEGPLMVNSEEEWTPELLEVYVRSLTASELQKFIDESRVFNRKSN